MSDDSVEVVTPNWQQWLELDEQLVARKDEYNAEHYERITRRSRRRSRDRPSSRADNGSPASLRPAAAVLAVYRRA
jgi:hypothetical protein